MTQETLPTCLYPLFETHVHLDYLKQASITEILTKSALAGVHYFLTIACSPDNQDTAITIASNYENVWCSQGLHPHDAKFFTKELEEAIVRNCSNPKVKAFGEIGLDYHYDHSPRIAQQKVFERQLQIAGDLDLPVIIHSRESEDDTITILSNHLSRLKRPLEIHSFTSNEKLATFALDNGFYIGFNGIITFKAAENVRTILRMTPIEQILLETDAPFLSPVPVRGKENAPFYLPYIAQKICEEKKLPPEDVLPRLFSNSLKFVNLPD